MTILCDLYVLFSLRCKCVKLFSDNIPLSNNIHIAEFDSIELMKDNG